MKNLPYLLLLCVSLIVPAQSVKLSTKIPGVNASISSSIPIDRVFNLDAKTPKTQEQQIGKATITQSKAIYKSIEYPVYMTKKGKLFIVYPNKEGTGYSKKYIKQE